MREVLYVNNANQENNNPSTYKEQSLNFRKRLLYMDTASATFFEEKKIQVTLPYPLSGKGNRCHNA